MTFLSQIQSATARRQSEYIGEGRYLCELLDFKEGVSRKGRDFVVAEMKVIDSDNPERHPQGAERSWMQMTDTDTAARNVRGFLTRALNVSDDGLTDDMIEAAFEMNEETGKSDLSGLMIGINARNITTRKGNLFTVCDFYAVNQDVTSLDG